MILYYFCKVSILDQDSTLTQRNFLKSSFHIAMLAFVATISFFFVTIFGSILFAWEMRLANISIMNKKIDILLELFCMRSSRRR